MGSYSEAPVVSPAAVNLVNLLDKVDKVDKDFEALFGGQLTKPQRTPHLTFAGSVQKIGYELHVADTKFRIFLSTCQVTFRRCR